MGKSETKKLLIINELWFRIWRRKKAIVPMENCTLSKYITSKLKVCSMCLWIQKVLFLYGLINQYFQSVSHKIFFTHAYVSVNSNLNYEKLSCEKVSSDDCSRNSKVYFYLCY